ncbi:WD repeat-containing protein 76 [Mactra antiquata]
MPVVRSRTNKAGEGEILQSKKSVTGEKRMLEDRASPRKKVKVVYASQPTDSDSEKSDEEDKYDIAKVREENIRLNQEFLSQIGINEAKQDLIASKKKNKPSQRGLKREKVPVELLPRRSSLRLQKKDPDGASVPSPVIEPPLYVVDDHPRPPAGPLDMLEYLHGTSDVEDHKEIRDSIRKLKTKSIQESKVPLDKYVSKMKKTKITENLVAKVVPDRTFSVAIHPSETKVIAAAGDKWGKIGIWNVLNEGKSTSDGVCCYKPHSRPICCLEFSVNSPEKVYSCSYDGSLRCGDLEKEIFTEVCSAPEDEDILYRNFSWLTPQTMLISQSDGCVSLSDIRTDGSKAEATYELHNRSIRTVSVHPVETQYFCTAGVEGIIRVWDTRNIKARKNRHVCDYHISRGINSAYFSPVTGKHILSTSIDDKLTVFDSSEIGKHFTLKKSISHNNHTGRWLTPFRATWHPAREDVFVVGSMSRPRQIQLYGVDGKQLHSFQSEDYVNSVNSLNVLHPTLDMVVGTNSSGRLHVFM